jgi:hypothetical protein
MAFAASITPQILFSPSSLYPSAKRGKRSSRATSLSIPLSLVVSTVYYIKFARHTTKPPFLTPDKQPPLLRFHGRLGRGGGCRGRSSLLSMESTEVRTGCVAAEIKSLGLLIFNMYYTCSTKKFEPWKKGTEERLVKCNFPVMEPGHLLYAFWYK